MCEDKYTYSQPITVGGPPGQYIADCPFSGDSYEWAVLVGNAGGGIGQAFITDDSARQIDVPYDASVSYGSIAAAPRTPLNGIPLRFNSNQCIVPNTVWFRLPNGAKSVYVYINAAAGTSIFITVVFRFLPVRVIPPRVATVPDTAEQQHNILRADKAIERLEMDIEKGDKVGAPYGKLQ